MHCQAYRDMQQFISQGGDVTQTDAPVVTQYPSKVSGSLCLLSLHRLAKAWTHCLVSTDCSQKVAIELELSDSHCNHIDC